MHFHRDVLAIADTFSRHVLKPTPDDVFTGTPPLAFTFGLGGLVVFPLRAGAATLLIEKADAGRAGRPRRRARRHRPVHRADRLPGDARRGQPALTAVAAPVRVGRRARCPPAEWEAFRDATGMRIIDGIGATEMLHIFISAADDDIRPGATGRPVPGYRGRRPRRRRAARCPTARSGRLAVKGPTGCRYLADTRQRTYVQNGWNITGDTYLRDADGYFWYQARSDDMIISSGYNIAGPEVEEALLAHPDVAGVRGRRRARRGPRHGRQGVRGAARRASPPTERPSTALQDFVKADDRAVQVPAGDRVRRRLPRTNTGKLQRFALREQVS